MSNSMASGTRVVLAIGVIKWVLIVLAMTGALVVVLMPLVDDTTGYSVSFGLKMAAGCVVWSLFIWVLFGWFEHTLELLVTIARNTAQQLPGSYDVPPASYDWPRG